MLKKEYESKKQLGINDYDMLSSYGTLGLYEECEFLHVFLIEDQQKYYHYYGLISFEEFTEPNNELRDIFKDS